MHFREQVNVKRDDKGILENDRGIFCSFCLITQKKGQTQEKKWNLKCPNTKLIEGTGFFPVLYHHGNF